MVRYKVFATIIISALILLFPKSAGALSLDLPVQRLYNVGVPQMKVFTNNGLCSASNPVQYVGCSLGTSGTTITGFDFFDGNNQLYLNPGEIAEIQLSYNTTYSNFTPGQILNNQQSRIVYSSLSGNTTTGDGTRSAGIWTIDYYQNDQSGGLVNLGFNAYPVASFSVGNTQFNNFGYLYISSITVYKLLDTVDSTEANDYYEQQNQGNDNIENQDTTGTNQGVSDDNYSSLLDIFSGFITAITNVSGGTCTISLNTDFANLGDVDLCTYDPPSYIQIIGSIILILLFVPLSMALIKRILKTIQELQQ